MSESDNLPRLPEDRMRPRRRKLTDVKPGERVILSIIENITADEEGHVWIDMSSSFSPHPLLPGMTLQAERTQKGFILWLDDEVRFLRSRRFKGRHYLPVVEFRGPAEEED